MMSSAITVKNMRNKLCLQQGEFAEKIGVTKSAVCNYEKGRATPSRPVIRELLRIARENNIDISVEDFLKE